MDFTPISRLTAEARLAGVDYQNFISKIAVSAMAQKSSAGWDDLDMNNYSNLARRADISVSSTYKSWSYKELMNDGLKYWDDNGYIGGEG